MNATRRGFFGGSLTTVAGLLLCGVDGLGAVPEDEFCPGPFAGGELLGTAGFTSDDRRLPKNTLLGQGWDARLCTDLENLDPTTMIVPNEHFFVRTGYPDQLDSSAAWSIDVGGPTGSPRSIAMSDLLPLVKDQGVHVMECAGNVGAGGFGLLGAARWGGVPMSDVLEMIDPSPSAAGVLISGFDGHSAPSLGGHSTPGASWIFSFDQLAASGAFLATQMNGVELSKDHGSPVRLVVPGWYACACIKWVNKIELVGEGAPATSQMKEFASRTHQDGAPESAFSYKPPSIDLAAMPIRIEKWRLGGALTYRVLGVLWGRYEPSPALSIRFNRDEPQRVKVCPTPGRNQPWRLWSYAWIPRTTGSYNISMVVDDPNIVTRRLDVEFYRRQVYIDVV